MKKHEVFTFTDSNGVEKTGIVVCVIAEQEENYVDGSLFDTYLCYAQNKLFYYKHNYGHYSEHVGFYPCGGPIYDEGEVDRWFVEEILVDCAILPDYDKMLLDYTEKKINHLNV